MNPERQEPEDPDSTLVALARYSGHGLTIAVSTALFLLAGWWLDGWLGTTPLLTVLGALLGAAAGFYSMLQHVLFLPREQEREQDGEGAAGPKAGGEGPKAGGEGPRAGDDGR